MGQQQQQHPPLPPPPEQQQSYSGQLQADRSGSARILDPDSLGGLCLSAMPRGEAHAQPLAQIAATVAVGLCHLCRWSLSSIVLGLVAGLPVPMHYPFMSVYFLGAC